MSDTTKYTVALTAPAPAPADLVPDTGLSGYKTYITLIAGFVAVTVMPAIHAKYAWFPALDVDATTAIVSTVVFLAIAFLRHGFKTSVQFILLNIGPVLLPEVERVVRGVVKQEVAKLPTNSGIDPDDLAKALDDIIPQATPPQKVALVAKLVAPSIQISTAGIDGSSVSK